MFKKILMGILALIAIILVVASLQPNEFRIERSTSIAAPADKVFAQLNDFHRWNDWSPWDKMDPTMQRTYSGPDAGVGAHYAWIGNKKVGQGAMTIEESKTNEVVKLKLEFLKPFKATNTTEFTLKADGDKTQLTWAMVGPNNFMAKVMHLFMNMDKMVGPDFEKGLAGIKTIAEGSGL